MHIAKLMEEGKVDFSGIPSSYFLLGLLTAFDNRFQASADRTMGEISWKQFFAVICTDLCREPPTLKELSEIMGCSHQNAKQILLKLQKKGFVVLKTDEQDKRKQRIHLTDTCRRFCQANEQISGKIMEAMFRGISETDLQTAIRTILAIEDNLKEMDGNENLSRL